MTSERKGEHTDRDEASTLHESERHHSERLGRTIAGRASRMQRARRAGDRGLWFGLGMFGLVGWSISVPLLIGLVIGRWLDGRFDGGARWSLSLMTLGLIVGAINVWNWLERERYKDEDSE